MIKFMHTVNNKDQNSTLLFFTIAHPNSRAHKGEKEKGEVKGKEKEGEGE